MALFSLYFTKLRNILLAFNFNDKIATYFEITVLNIASYNHKITYLPHTKHTSKAHIRTT